MMRPMEDAVTDRLDVIALAVGGPALWGPNDRGSTCQLSGSQPCDPQADAVENAIRMGMTVVVSAGKDGHGGYQTQKQSLPPLNSTRTPVPSPHRRSCRANTQSHA